MPEEESSDNLVQLIQERKDQLQARLGAFPAVYIERFQNWGRNQKALALAVKPKSLQEIQVRHYLDKIKLKVLAVIYRPVYKSVSFVGNSNSKTCMTLTTSVPIIM